jgi:DNA-binding transcriptional LysR family regulator
MSDRLFALRLFVRVAHTASFSRAARELKLSQPSASRIIAKLEHEVGAKFFTRSTRAVTLTDSGAEYLARVEPMLAALDEADYLARGTGELRGTIRVALSSSFGVREVIPRLPPFMQRHPKLRVDLLMDDRQQDLIGDGVDIAFRLGALADSTATARSLGARPRVLVAAPGYLRRAGKPKTAEDLAKHALIAGPVDIRSARWPFSPGGHPLSIHVQPRLSVSSNEGAIAAALAGLGIAYTALWGCQSDVERGALVRILPDLDMGVAELHAVFPAGRSAKPAARAFADYLNGALEK